MTMLQTLAVLRDNTPMPLPQVDLGKVPDASAAGPLANYFGVSTPTIMAVATALDGDMQRTAKIVADALAPISKAQADMVTMGVNYLREAGKLASQYLTFVPVTMAATTAQIENLSQQTQKAAVSRSNQLIRELEPLTKQLNDLAAVKPQPSNVTQFKEPKTADGAPRGDKGNPQPPQAHMEKTGNKNAPSDAGQKAVNAALSQWEPPMCGEEPLLGQDLTAQGSRSGHGDKPGSSCQGSPKNKTLVALSALKNSSLVIFLSGTATWPCTKATAKSSRQVIQCKLAHCGPPTLEWLSRVTSDQRAKPASI